MLHLKLVKGSANEKMLLADFKEVITIDKQINKLHRELSALYEERMAITNSTGLAAKNTTHSTSSLKNTQAASDWEQEQYEFLRLNWLKFDQKIPSFSALQTKLSSAKAILANLPRTTDGQDFFELFLVPPSSRLGSPFDGELLSVHQTVGYEVFSQTDVSTPINQKNWKLMIVFKDPKGLPVNDYEDFIANKRYIVNGYDMSGLNVREYGLYALLQDEPIDVECWSLLPANGTFDNQHVVCSGFVGRQYRCVVDDVRSLLGTNSFRPAIEVK